MLASVNSVRSMRSFVRKNSATKEELRSRRDRWYEKRVKESGMAGLKLGKHQVREGKVDVQLGEELSESLRGLQVCGYFLDDCFEMSERRCHCSLKAIYSVTDS